MSKNIIIIIIVILGSVLLLGVFYYSPRLFKKGTANISEGGDSGKIKITVYKSPTCSCCGGYISYLKKQGFEVETIDVKNMLSLKEKYKISSEMESCHTSIIGDYFVEGHMPIEAIRKLLEEKPDILGIALPGMPSGSPGMSGFKKGEFIIYGLSKNGGVSEFLRI